MIKPQWRNRSYLLREFIVNMMYKNDNCNGKCALEVLHSVEYFKTRTKFGGIQTIIYESSSERGSGTSR